VRSSAVAVLAALALGFVDGCSARPPRDDTAAELARALGGATEESGATTGPAALPPATLDVVQPPTPLRGANGLACVERRVAVAEALGDRIVFLSPDGTVEPLDIPRGLSGPDDLLLDASGALVATGAASGNVWRRQPRGGWSKLVADLPGVNAIAQSPDGRLFVSACGHGDGLYEIDRAGGSATRRIAADLGCPNAMLAEADGTLIVPLLERGSVVRVGVAGGTTTTLASGLRAPTAVRRAPDGSLVVLESGTGAIRSLGSGAPASGPGNVVAQLDPGIDGFAMCGESAIVSNFVTGEVVAFKPWPQAPRVLTAPGLAAPHGLAASGEDLLLSDGVSIRRLHGGAAQVVVATAIDPIPPPFGLALAPGGVAWITVPHFGEVHRVDLAARTADKVAGGLDWPTSVVPSPRGGVLVLDTGAGRIVEIQGDGSSKVIAGSLVEPLGLALRGGQLLTAEPEGGRLLGLREGSPPSLVASGLAEPVGIASDARGRVYVAEARTGYVVRVDGDGSRTRVAQGFDFRHARAQRMPIPMVVDGTGDLLIALPGDGSVLRLHP